MTAFNILFNGVSLTSAVAHEITSNSEHGMIVTVYGRDGIRTFCNVTEVHTGLVSEMRQGETDIALESDHHSTGLCTADNSLVGGIMVIMITEATCKHPDFHGKSLKVDVDADHTV